MAKDDIVDTEAEAGPDPFFTGLVVFTTVALLVAFFVIESGLKDYERGMF